MATINFHKTTYFSKAILNHVFHNTQMGGISQAWLGFLKSDPTEAGTGEEVALSTGYGRQVFTATPVESVENGTGQITYLAEDIVFPEAVTDAGTVTHAAIFDSETGGNMLYYCELPKAKTIDQGDFIRVNENNASVTED